MDGEVRVILQLLSWTCKWGEERRKPGEWYSKQGPEGKVK